MANLMEVLKRMSFNDEQEDVTDRFAQSALQQRFQPNTQDAATGIFNRNQASAYPEFYGKQPLNAQMAAGQRMTSELAPLAQELELQGAGQKLMAGQQDYDIKQQMLPLDLQLKQAQAQAYSALAGQRAMGGGGNAPAGYRYLPTGDLEAIPGGPATKLPGETAGKLGLAQSALGNLPNIKNIFGSTFDPLKNTGDYAFSIGKIGEGKRQVRQAVEAGLRLTSGAAVPPSEVDRYEALFLPTPLDTEPTRASKLIELERFLTTAVNNASLGHGGELLQVPGLNNTPDDGITEDAIQQELQRRGVQ